MESVPELKGTEMTAIVAYLILMIKPDSKSLSSKFGPLYKHEGWRCFDHDTGPMIWSLKNKRTKELAKEKHEVLALKMGNYFFTLNEEKNQLLKCPQIMEMWMH